MTDFSIKVTSLQRKRVDNLCTIEFNWVNLFIKTGGGVVQQGIVFEGATRKGTKTYQILTENTFARHKICTVD